VEQDTRHPTASTGRSQRRRQPGPKRGQVHRGRRLRHVRRPRRRRLLPHDRQRHGRRDLAGPAAGGRLGQCLAAQAHAV